MLVTCLVSIFVFFVSIIFGFICKVLPFAYQVLTAFILSLIMFLIFYVIESKLIEKYRLNKTVYNVVTLQIPAILCILCSLLLWIFIPNYYITKVMLFSGKYILIPIMLLRMAVELLNKKSSSLIISCGITIGIIVGILFMNFMP